jgi:putative ABC transport system substrate-binding protein
MTRLAIIALASALCLIPFRAVQAAAPAAETGPVAVIYPNVREPYRAAFLAIVAGITEELGERADVQEVATTENANDISARLAGRDAQRVLLLGKYGLDVMRELKTPLDRVIGAVMARPGELPEGVRGISMVPAPARLFATLHELAPKVTRVTLVHGADNNDWLVELGQSAAKSQGITLETLRRDTLRDGANAYRERLAQMDPAVEALWLPQGSPFLAESSVLQMILRTAWDRNIVVFSSNIAHVPKGALFALFPDNTAMGKALGRLAAHPPAGDTTLAPLEQLHTAINIRTANHLGLGLNAADQRFEMVFPSR